MDGIPVEIIGNILSKVGAARDVVIASATCRKWREAFRKHLRTLSFNSNDSSLYQKLDSRDLEFLITKTIFQTKGLQCLSILIGSGTVQLFSACIVYTWLVYTRETLRELHYNVKTKPHLNILDIFSGHRLEVIELAKNPISIAEPKFHSFPCLKKFSLRYQYQGLSQVNLNLLFSTCPKIELLELGKFNICTPNSDLDVKLQLSVPTLKSIFLDTIHIDKLFVEADCLEIIHLKDMKLEDFELTGKGSLKQLKLDGVSVVTHLYIGENIENLEVVDISNAPISWPIVF